MRRPQGLLIESPIDGSRATEHDTVTCGHCCRVAVIPPGLQPGQQCRRCMRFVCKACYGKLTSGHACVPFEKKLDLYEKHPGRYVLR